MKDPYSVLGVPKDADAAQIKSAYRKLAKELHPDVNPGDSIVEQRFKEVTAAYNLLSDPEKKAKYDRGEIGADGTPNRGYGGRQRAGAGGGGGFGGGGFGGFEAEDVEDFFGDIFGRQRQRQRNRTVKMRGKDVNYTINVTFEEAALGVKRRLKLYDGSHVDVDIPPGTSDGQSLRLRGKGMPGMGGGEAGDAFVEIQVQPHKFFERDGNDIFLELPVTITEALLGARVRVPTIHGPVAVKIPAGSNTGTSLRLNGKGVGGRKGGPGDQYVQLKVMLPDKPDADLNDFVREWSAKGNYDVRKKLGFPE
ncbi:J domain-containing protein [Hwanghaeella grinnelliae]|uniref:J domain-containing protein n=1 Tax=Hwanghaeella grinnelliae TaxID=2500179 RepID=A0A437QH53_9PROT|nr:DnaJ C-terminal domain-containing protein [Hwanghaeella grinnelliae]RVU33842.1 J domain-containing protein [Hwanghaeella grinnelliae]